MKTEIKKFEKVIVGNLQWSHQCHAKLLADGYVLESKNDVNRCYVLLDKLGRNKDANK